MPVDYNQLAQIAYLSWVQNVETAEANFIRTCRDYVGGDHPTYLTDRQKEYLGLLAKDSDYLYAHNFCGLVIAALVERLFLTGFVPEIATDETDLPARAVRWMAQNRADALQDDLYEAACRDGKSYLIVEWDAQGYPHWVLNQAWDGTQGVRLHRDPNTDAILFAVKQWQVYDPYDSDLNGRQRWTLYFPDRVEKYISTKASNAGIGGMQMENYKDAPNEAWPIPWVNAAGLPLGLAVIPFENPGGSEIAQILSLQDALNKSDLDLLATEDTAGFRILYASGLQVVLDSDGKEIPLKISPGHLVRMSDPQGRLGSIEPTDLSQLIRASKYWIESIAGITRTPQYLFQAMGADQPSGESLRQQEIGLVKKAERRQRMWGNAWEDVIYLSAKLHNLYVPGDVLDIVPLQAQWASPQFPPDPVEKRKAQAEARKVETESGLPLVIALEREGWTKEEIAALQRAKKRERADQTASLAQALLEREREFNQGEQSNAIQE